MKKVLLFILPLFTLPVFGQITVDSSHVANHNDLIIQENDTIPGIALSNYTSSGGSQTWNFSALNSHYKDTFDIDPASTGWGYSYFFGADYTMGGDVDTSSIYLSKTDTNLVIDGLFQVTGGDTLIYRVSNKILTFPSTNGTSYTHKDDAMIGAQEFGADPDGPGPHPYVDSLGVHRYLDQNSAVNAWGTASMSKGNFGSLRQDAEDATTDSVKMYANGQWQPLSPTMVTIIQNNGAQEVTYDTTWTLRFWTRDPSAPLPVVEIEYDKTLDSIYHVTWLDTTPTLTSIKKLAKAEYSVELYPNPAESFININTDIDDAAGIDIYNINGRKVRSESINSGRNKINIRGLSKGMYLYRIVDEKNEMLHSGKFNKH